MFKKKITIVLMLSVLVSTVFATQISVSAKDNQNEGNIEVKEPTFTDKEGNIITKDEGVEVENKQDVFVQHKKRSTAIINGVVNFNTKGNVAINTNFIDETGFSGYTNGAYGADAAFLGYEQNNSKVKFMMSGVVGLVNASEVKVLDYDAMDSNRNSVSFYRVEDGKLYHYVTTNVNAAKWAGINYVGPGPESLVPNTVYYSYDGKYFFESYDKMIASYKKNTSSGVGAKNEGNPYYNYFQYLNLRSHSTINATQFNNYFNQKTTSDSKLRNLGSSFVNYGNKYGVNPLISAALAANESGWGSSWIAQNKNNLFGLNAVDTSPGESANKYSSPQDCVKQFMEHWMSKGYLMPKDGRARGASLGDKSTGINVKYASDPYWGEKAAGIAWNISDAITKENNRYTIAVKDSLSKVNIRSQANTSSSVLYTTSPNKNLTFIVLGEVTGSWVDGSNLWYKIQSDAVLNADRTQMLAAIGDYNFENDFGYIHSSLIKKVSSGNKMCELPSEEMPNIKGITYQTNVSNDCWQNWKSNGELSGTTGQQKSLEGVRISLNGYSANASVSYRVHVQDLGWQDWKKNGQVAGASFDGKQIEAIEIKLANIPGYRVEYRAHVQSIGWQDWVSDGKLSGTVGQSKRIEAIEIKLVRLNSQPVINYQTHVQSIGWQGIAVNGALSGTVGKELRLEALKINVDSSELGGVEYSSHVQDIGWQSWKKDNEVSGTEGKSKRIEAIRIKLYGDIAKTYDIYYRTHVEKKGWLGWAKNGEMAGSAGYSYRLEAIEIKLVKKGDMITEKVSDAYVSSKVKYKTHVEKQGWQDYVYNGGLSGTTGKALRLESINIKKIDDYIGDIQYRVHVEKQGWQTFKANGEIAGTIGQSLRMEAIEIKLTSELAEKYDVYYRTHVEKLGWLGWAKNGQPSGSEGYSYRLEGVEIVFVNKGSTPPGTTVNSFKKK